VAPSGLAVQAEPPASTAAREHLVRKLIETRGHFPDDDAAIKLLYLGIRNITGRHIDGDGLIRERAERFPPQQRAG
jgi:transposase-like protein